MKTSNESIAVMTSGKEIILDASSYSYLNIGAKERVASTLAGALLTAYGALLAERAPRRSGSRWYQLVALPVGMYLLKRGISGYCAFNNIIGRNTADKSEFEPVEVYGQARVSKRPKEVYAMWRNLENLPRFLPHIQEVKVTDDKHSEWTLRLPGGVGKLHWNAELIHDVPNERISWQSVEGSDIGNEGEVRFMESKEGKGTDIHVSIRYIPPAGKLGKGVAELFSAAFRKALVKELESIGKEEETPATA